MKKFYTIFFAALALVAFAACDKEAITPDDNSSVDPGQEEVDPQQPTDIPEGMVQLTFTVSTEGEGSKTSLGDKDANNSRPVLWSENDQIRILWVVDDEVKYTDVTVIDDIVTANVDPADHYYAVYPAASAADFVLNTDGKIDVSIRRWQDGSFASANKMVARTTSTDLSFAFKNVTHIFSFSLTDSCIYDNFEFTSNENAKLIVDAIGVTFDAENAITIGASTTSYSSFSGTHSKYVDLNNLEKGKDYYFAVVPGSNFNSGFGVKAHISGVVSEDEYNLGALSKADVTTTRGHITPLGILDSKIHEHWFIKPDATGDGSTWENAGGLSLFLSLIKTKTNDNGVNSTWRLKNAKIHFMEGDYNIQAANNGKALQFDSNSWDQAAGEQYKVNNVTLIDGGYPSTSEGTDLTGQNPVKYPTNWMCTQDANNQRVFYANGCQFSDWTFKGITFTNNPNATNVNTRGIAFFFNAATGGKVTFDNCIFKNITSSNTNGGAVDFNSTAELTVTFSGCTFDNNVVSGTNSNFGGAAISVEQGASTTVNITNCTAQKNQATSTNGQGGFLFNKGATVNITGGTFSNNTAVAKGGAIYVASGSVTIDGATIEGDGTNANAVSGGGAFVASGATLTVQNNSKIQNCKATNGGGIYSDGGTTSVTSGSQCSNNVASDNGGAIYVASGSVTIDGATIEGDGTNANAVSGGGAFVASGATLTVQNSSKIQNCKASSYGGGIHSNGTLVLRSSTFQGNNAVNGGGVSNENTDSRIYNCTFTNNRATNGAAVKSAGTSDAISHVYIFNSLFDGNVATTSGCIQSATVSRVLIANSTVRNVTSGDALTFPSNTPQPYFFIISCTLADNNKDLTRGAWPIFIHNSIMMTGGTTSANVKKYKTVFGGKYYDSTGNEGSLTSGFSLGSFSKGFYPLNSTYKIDNEKGYSENDLSSISFKKASQDSSAPEGSDDLLSLGEDASLLLSDQKGNPRTGTIMGAYVLTE